MPKTKLGTGNDVIELAIKSEELEWYIEWLALPTKARPQDVRSQVKAAEYLGVSEQTLRNWKRDPRVQTRVGSLRTSRLRIEDLPNILDTLVAQATDPQNPRSVAAAKLLIEESNRIVEESQQANLSEMSNRELKELVVELYDEIDDREHDGAAATS
jgi:transposase-like protein